MAYLEELLPEFRNGAKIREPNWAQGEYIYLGKNGIVYDERNKTFDFINEELFVKWEFYQEPIDLDYIIKNKCLCWFWDRENNKFARYLNGVLDGNMAKFIDDNNVCWYNCRPVRIDEVTFYEDRKDE